MNVHENKYKEIQSFSCLQEVSQIPIAIVEDVPELNSIKAQKLGDHIVNQTFSLTKLSDSSIIENKHLVWTIKPLINLNYNHNSPVCLNRLEDLGVVLTPSVEDVVLNLKNLSTTVFASCSRFTSFDLTKSNSYLLPEVVVAMLQHIQTALLNNSNVSSFEEACNQLQLSSTNILPVRLQNNDTEQYALVMPTQVLNMTSSDMVIDFYYPILHPLIDEAKCIIHLLSNIGVQGTINFSHIQYILHLAKRRFKENELDPKTESVVIKATEELVKLLQNTEPNDLIVQHLQPLYLLSDYNVLMECSKLVVCDINISHNFLLPTGYAYLHPLTGTGVSHMESALLHNLPKELGLISLKSMLKYEIVDNEPAENIFPCVSIIEEILKSNKFTEALILFSNCCTHGTTPDCVTEILTNFQRNLTVQYLNTVDVKPYFLIDGNVIASSDTLNYLFFLDKITDQQWTLSLKNAQHGYTHPILLQLAKQLCSKLKLRSTGCFDITDDDDLLDLATFVWFILQCDSISSISSVIKDHLPGVHSELSTDVDALSESASDKHLLDLFSPKEWIDNVTEQDKGNASCKQILQKVADTFFEWKESEPQIDFNEAKIWIQQAQYDYSALCALNVSKTDEKQHFATICFMCQQVAEKSLKAGIYAKCGLEQMSLHTHDLIHLANKLKQVGVDTIYDAVLLNDFYLPTRYPNHYCPSAVPGDKFTREVAKQGFDAATRIFEAMQEMINNIVK